MAVKEAPSIWYHCLVAVTVVREPAKSEREGVVDDHLLTVVNSAVVGRADVDCVVGVLGEDAVGAESDLAVAD